MGVGGWTYSSRFPSLGVDSPELGIGDVGLLCQTQGRGCRETLKKPDDSVAGVGNLQGRPEVDLHVRPVRAASPQHGGVTVLARANSPPKKL
jgi:hypothetical protein